MSPAYPQYASSLLGDPEIYSVYTVLCNVKQGRQDHTHLVEAVRVFGLKQAGHVLKEKEVDWIYFGDGSNYLRIGDGQVVARILATTIVDISNGKSLAGGAADYAHWHKVLFPNSLKKAVDT